ncbi:MAG: hypothetical protein RLZZ524_461 [Pseudomonadota bacterium]
MYSQHADAGYNTTRGMMLRQKQALWNERSSWLNRWRDISRYQQPFAGRFLVTDNNRGDTADSQVLDETAIFCADTLAAGFMSGATSPARPWHRLEVPDKDLMEYKPVKSWLFRVAELQRAIFAASNTYNALRMGYEELGLFGTWADVVESEFETVIHHHPLTVGEYALATNAKNRVDTLVRELRMTVVQCIRTFGRENCSPVIRNLYDRGNYFDYVEVVHFIAPRDEREREYGKRDAKNMPWKSCYFEPNADSGYDKFLRESGYKRFPVIAPRWATRGRDVYGRGPGMNVRGSVKQLQHEQLAKGRAIDYQSNPPRVMHSSLRGQEHLTLPGRTSFSDVVGPQSGVRSAFDVPMNLQHLGEDIEDVRSRIRRGYYTDLFLMLANDNRSGVTATEVAQRHEEKLLMLGPVIENIHGEGLSPLIDISFDAISEAGLLQGNLAPPPELENMQLQVRFVSVLAQAQRMVAAGGMDRLLATVGTIATQKQDPGVWDKVDTDQTIDDYADMFGVNPEIIRSDDEVAAIAEQRAAQQRAQQQAAAAQQMAQTAKDLAGADMSGDNALTGIMRGLQGY